MPCRGIVSWVVKECDGGNELGYDDRDTSGESQPAEDVERPAAVALCLYQYGN